MISPREKGRRRCGGERQLHSAEGTPSKLEEPKLVRIGTLMFCTISGNGSSRAKVILVSGK